MSNSDTLTRIDITNIDHMFAYGRNTAYITECHKGRHVIPDDCQLKDSNVRQTFEIHGQKGKDLFLDGYNTGLYEIYPQ